MSVEPSPAPQSRSPHPPPPALDTRTIVVLFHGERMLLLKRAAWKKIEPGRWTGLGGKVENGEFDDLAASARRELFEETDLAPEEVSGLTLRRTLTFAHPVVGIILLLYFTGHALTGRLPSCNEGTLAWVAPEEISTLDVIDNTARVLPMLVDDIRAEDERVLCGIERCDVSGRLEEVVFNG